MDDPGYLTMGAKELNRLEALKDVAAIVKPETIHTWYRKLVAKQCDGSAKRRKSRHCDHTT